MTFRLVAFDIDGTLLGSDRQLQPGTRLGLEAIREAGAQIMLASGRPIPGLKQLAEKLEIGEECRMRRPDRDDGHTMFTRAAP